jgi:O-antigen/teichoic acid export membrane protein
MPWRPLGSTSIPYIAEAMKTSNLPSLKSIYQKSSLNLFIVGIMLFILIFTSIDPILSIIPDDYTNIKYAFLFLGIGKIIDMLTGVNANILSLSPYYKYNLYFNVVLIVIVFIANALLIPVFGITGSAMATAFCLLGINVLKCILVYKKYGIQPLHKNSWKVAVGMGVIFVAGMYMPVMFTKAIPEILMRGSILFLLMYVFLVWIKPSEDIEKMRINILRRIKLV